jgi:hypothetical protein
MSSLYIGIPTSGTLRAETFISYNNALLYMLSKGIPVQTGISMSNHIDDNRNRIVLKALEGSSTHIMMIDTDMIFPADGIYRLLQQEKDIIGGNYNKRLLPLSDGSTSSTVKMRGRLGEPVPIGAIPDKTFRCHSTPGGFLLIRKSIFDKIRFPYFSSYQKGYSYYTEDVDFGEKCAKAGISVWCDPTINIGHIGQAVY